MATKMYNSHLSTILYSCNEYYILDTYMALVHISSEVNSKYIRQNYSDSKADLISLRRNRYVKASYKTVFNCLNTLIEKNIISYDNTIGAWTLNDMENMTKSADNAVSLQDNTFTGYTKIRSFFFTDEFSNMKAREKRLIVYMAQLSDSKASEFHNGFSMNLLKHNSGWLKVLKTKCRYYAKYTIEKLLNKYSELFKDTSEDFRQRDYSPDRNKKFKFSFYCPSLDTRKLEEDTIELVKLANIKEYNMIMDKLKFAEVTLSKKLVMHFVRAISNIKEWFIKERVVQLIVNKYRAIQVYHSRENIKSLPAYAAAVVKAVVKEYRQFKSSNSLENVKKYEVGEYFMEYIDNNANEDISYDIEKSLSLF